MLKKRYLYYFTIERITLVILSILFAITLYSVAKSAYSYQFDGDEFYHSQITYLIDHGNQIYHSFLTAYTPIFYWVLRPVFHLIGYDNYSVMYAGRAYMIIFFLLRLLLLFLGIRLISTTKAALIGIFLLILDPFAVMTAATIRPDSLMLLLYTLGIFAYIYGRKKQSKIILLASGVCMSLSLITLMKIIPCIVAFFMIAGYSAIRRKQVKNEGFILLGFVLGFVFTVFYFITQGLLEGVIIQTIIEPFSIFNAFLYPVYFGFYFKEGNMWIFGPINRSIAWIYAQLMNPFAGLGIGVAYITGTNKKSSSLLRDTLAILVLALVLQWVWLLTVPSVFIQYYLTIHWIVAMLAGLAIGYFWQESQNFHVFKRLIISVALIMFFTYFTQGSYKINIFRSNITSQNEFTAIQAVWDVIPKDALVFPNFLFRQIAYPAPTRSPFTEIPTEILKKMPAVPSVLERLQVKYVFNDSWFMQNLPADAQAYIATHYEPSNLHPLVLTRKSKIQ